MTTFDDLKAWLDERDAQQEDLVAGLQQQVTRLSESEAALRSENTRLTGEVDRLTLALEACEETPGPDPEPEPDAKKIIGMSAPADLWDQRLSEVGANGITARRIFGFLNSAGTDQQTEIREAIAAGMLPVLSYKPPKITGTNTSDVEGFLSGKYDSMVAALRNFLVGLDVPICLTYFHEPRGNMTPAQHVAGAKRFLDIFERLGAGLIEFGPILNGWLLDRNVAEFRSYYDADLIRRWDFMGMDVYHPSATSTVYPGHRIAPLLKVLEADGRPDMPIVIGEYNGFTAEAIAESGETFLSTPSVAIAMMWNSTGQSGLEVKPLEGERLAAFKQTKADPRVRQ